MDFPSPQRSNSDDIINNFFDGVEEFRSKWIALSERCKQLEITLHQVETEKAQLQTKLELSCDYTKRVEKEKEEFALIVQELHKELKNNSFHRWIDTLGQKLSSLNETVKNPIAQFPGSRTTSKISRVIDEIELTSGDEEDNSNLNSLEVFPKKVGNKNQFEENVNRSSSDESDSNNINDPEIAVSLTDNEYLVAYENLFQQNVESSNKKNYTINDGKNLPINEVATTALEVTEKENRMMENSIPCDIFAENRASTSDETTYVSNDQISCDDHTILLKNSSSIIPLTKCDRSHATNDIEIISCSRELECSDQSHSSNSISSLVIKEKCSILNVNFSEDESMLSKSSYQKSSANDEMPSKNNLINSYNSNASVITRSVSSESLPQLIPLPNIIETKSATNVCENTDNNQCYETNTSDPPQLFPITNNEESTYGKESIDFTKNSISSSPKLTENLPRSTSVKNNETSAENCLKISNIERDIEVDSRTSIEFPQNHFLASCSKTLNERLMNFHISTNTVLKPTLKQLQFTSETLLQQGVNLEEAPSAHAPFKTVTSSEVGVEWSDESGDAHVKSSLAGGDKSINQRATVEELLCQIFGSPSISSGHNSDVECLREKSCKIDLNLSEENEKLSADKNTLCATKVQPELTVNLPRIFTPNTEIIDRSVLVRDMLSSSEKETECTAKDDQTEIVTSKRFYSSSSRLEPKSKRVSPNKSSEFNQDYTWYSNLPNKCLLCKDDVTYGSYALLDKHIISIHPNPYPKYFRCPYGQGNCERHFRTTKRVNDHVRRRHAEEDLSLPVDKLFPGQKAWRCFICEKVYARHNHFRAHLHKIHRESGAKTDRIIEYKQKIGIRKHHFEKK